MGLSSQQRERYQKKKEELEKQIDQLARKDTDSAALKQSDLTDQLLKIQRKLEGYTDD